MMSRRMMWLTLTVCCVWLSCVTGYAAPPQPKVLNNFVSELLNVKMAASAQRDYEFTNPRDGWIFFSTTLDEIRPSSIRVSMKRKAKKPNVINQEIRNLEAGRLYSLRMFTCDTDDLKTRQKHALSVNLKGVEVISQESRQEISQGDSLRKRIPCWNYHYRLFRATEEKASIEISDWAAPHTPGGPIGQELLLNFIQVQPFFKADGGE